MHPDLQRELKLSPDQISKIQELIPKPGERPANAPARASGEGRRPGEAPNPAVAMDLKVREILTVAQESRYEQILLQHFGMVSILRPDISEKLNITEDQKLRIHEAMKAIRSDYESKNKPTSTMEERLRYHEEMKSETERRLTAILTNSQRSEWQAMLGKPFKLEMPTRRPGN